MSIQDKEDKKQAAELLSKRCGCAVLLKGGHSAEDASDLLYDSGEFTWFEGKRIDTPNTHGTGCTLSSAIAANLAKGFPLCEAIRQGKAYVTGALEAGLNLGKGSGPLHHAFDLKSEFAKTAESHLL